VSLLDKLRRDPPPTDLLRALDRGDRLLGWAVLDDGTLLAASRLGLRLADGRLVPWHTVDNVVWRAGTLIVTEAAEVSAGVREALPPVTLSLTEPRDLPAVVRARIIRSIAYTTTETVRGARIRIVARRVPGRDGLSWSLRFDSAADRDDPGVRAAADQLLTETQSNLTL